MINHWRNILISDMRYFLQYIVMLLVWTKYILWNHQFSWGPIFVSYFYKNPGRWQMINFRKMYKFQTSHNILVLYLAHLCTSVSQLNYKLERKNVNILLVIHVQVYKVYMYPCVSTEKSSILQCSRNWNHILWNSNQIHIMT